MILICIAGIKKKSLKSLRVMSNINVFATQRRTDGRLGGRPNGWANMTHYIDPYDTHMDQKCYWKLYLIIISLLAFVCLFGGFFFGRCLLLFLFVHLLASQNRRCEVSTFWSFILWHRNGYAVQVSIQHTKLHFYRLRTVLDKEQSRYGFFTSGDLGRDPRSLKLMFS